MGIIIVFLQKVSKMNLEIHFYPIYGCALGIDYFDNDHDEDRDWDIKTICLQLFVVGINFNFYE